MRFLANDPAGGETWLLYRVTIWMFGWVCKASWIGGPVISRAMIINAHSFKTLCNRQTFVPYYVHSASISRYPTSSSPLVPRRRHWKTTLGSRPGSPVVSSANCPNCFHRSSGPPIDFFGRRVLHLLGSIASPQHNRNTPSSLYISRKHSILHIGGSVCLWRIIWHQCSFRKHCFAFVLSFIP